MTTPPRPFDVTNQIGATTSGDSVSQSVTAATRPSSSRFAQLTYSSFDDGTGISGGWQVKETSGSLSDVESEALRYWVNTTFDLVSPLPQFPTPEDVENFPRRLMYTSLDNGRAGYWHTVPAGADGSGRPGNVFAHTVLDRNVEATDIALRPIELWRSADWLVPYGAGEVASAVLKSATLPRAARSVSRESVIDFLCDPDTWRLGILSVLLDAAAAALDGGAPVVLATDTPDSAALWIGAVSHLTSPGTARTLHWSTFDRASGVATTMGRGVHLIAIPTADLPSMVSTDGIVVLSENEMPSMGDLGGAAHRTEAGSTVAVTEWSVIAQGILIEPETAHIVLAALDRVSEELGDSSLHATLSLALAVADTPELHDDVGDEAAAVIARYAPERLRARAALVGPASDLIDRTLGTTASDSWIQLRSVRPDRDGRYSVAAELIMAAYIERSLSDSRWLLQPGGVPFPAVPPRSGWMPQRLSAAVELFVSNLLEKSRSANEVSLDEALYSLRAIDLLFRASCVGRGYQNSAAPIVESTFALAAARPPSPFESCEDIVDKLVVRVLSDPELGPRFCVEFGRLSERTSEQLVWRLLSFTEVLQRGVIGRRLPHQVLEWSLPVNLVPPQHRSLLDPSSDGPSPLTILAAELAAWKMGDPIEGARWSDFNLLVLWRVLHQSDNQAVVPPDLGTVFAARLDVDALSRLISAYPGSIPPRYLLPSLALEPWSDSIRALALAVEEGNRISYARPLAQLVPRDDLAVALSSIRLRPGWPAMESQTRQQLQDRALMPLIVEVLKFGAANLTPDVVRTLAALSMVQMLNAGGNAPVPEAAKVVVRAAEVTDRAALVKEFATWVRSEDLKVEWLVESAVLGSDEAPEKKAAMPAERFLCSLTEDVEDRPVSLLDAVVDLLVEDKSYRGPTDSDGVEVGYRKRVSETYGRDADKVFGQYRKFSKKWLDERGLGAAGLISRLRGKP
ncbi:hypothetical protein [Rhodococcus sp. MALMAid1271]|uniref:GAP1-N2 domain-containing protein n=1 Tax=Rhodococcus sp. MALMAid1271 TaxID=3411744 RepID=UPI003BA25229